LRFLCDEPFFIIEGDLN